MRENYQEHIETFNLVLPVKGDFVNELGMSFFYF